MPETSPLKLSPEILGLLRCPANGMPLRREGAELCTDDAPASHYPLIDGVPILIDDATSLFSVASVVDGERQKGNEGTPRPRLRQLREAIEHGFPQLPATGVAVGNFTRLSTELLALAARPRVLVVGGGDGGAGFDVLARAAHRFELIESDVRVTSRTHLVCDAHRLPFADASLHGVVIQAVLEHVLDPYLCVSEIHRVLAPGGLVYAETPFMQQVHMGRHDFTRFTYLGHRRLFRWFEQIDAGAVCGPGMAVRWSLEYYVRSATSSRELRWLGSLASRALSWPFERFDPWLVRRPGAWDAASALFFLGRRASEPLSDQALLACYPSADARPSS